MQPYDDEFLVSDSQSAAPVSPLVVEQAPPGIGLAPAAGQAPVADATGVAPLSRQQINLDRRKEAIGKMGGIEKVLSALGEFGAGVTGRASPLDTRLKQQTEDRAVKLQEFKVHTEALQDGIKMVGKLRGDARTQFIEQYATQLDEVRPGMGDTYRSLAKQPDMAQVLAKYAAKSQTLRRALELDPSGDAAMKLLGSMDAMKTINGEIDSSVMPLLLKKGQTFKMGWQQLVPPEIVERFSRDGRISASELLEANNWIKENKPDVAKDLAFSDEELQIIGRNQEAFYGALDIASPKTEQDIIKKRAELKSKMEPGQVIDIPRGGKSFDKGAYDPEGKLFPNAKHDENGFAILGKGTKEGTTITFPSSSGFGVNPDTGQAGHYTIGKNGEVRWDKVQPAPKDVNPIQKAIADIIKNHGKGTKSAASASRTPTQADRDYVKAHPEFRQKFINTFGVNP